MFHSTPELGQTSTTPNLSRLHTPLHTDTGSSSSGVPPTGTVRLQSVAGGQPQNPVALEPSRGPPRGQQGVIEQPLQPPPQFRVPQPPPPQAEFVSPFSLLEDSLKTLNDYCGTLISKRDMDYHHAYPFYMQDSYKTDYASILDIYIKAGHVRDCLTKVVKQFGAPRERMFDIAEALIKALNELLQMLCPEEMPEEQIWNVHLYDMVDFLVDPVNRNELTVAKKQMKRLHYSLFRIALHDLS